MANPTTYVYIDWDDDGLWEAGENEADYVDWMRCKRSASTLAGDGAASQLTINLRNETGRFSPDNSSSPLYGNLDVGKKVWVYCTYSSVDYGLFAGYISKIVPLPDTRRVQVIVDDPLARWRRTDVYLSPSNSRSVRDVRGAVLDALGLTAGQRSLAYGNEADWAGTTGTGRLRKKALDVLEDCNLSTMSRHFIQPSATGATWFQYVTRERNYGHDAAVSETINNAESMEGYEVSDETVINEATVEVTPVDLDLSEKVWVLRFDVRVPAGTSRTIYPQWQEDDEWVSDAILSATYSPTGAGYSVVLTNWGDRAKIVMTAGAAEMKVTDAYITGRPARREDVLAVTSSSGASQTKYGERAAATINAAYTTSISSAEGVADHIIWRRKNPRKTPTIRVRNDFPAMLRHKPFDQVTVTYSRLAVTNRRFEIVGFDWQVADAGTAWLWNYHLIETPSQTTMSFFRVGGTAAEGVGGTGILAY